MDGINDLEYKELRLDLVDLTEGVVGSFLFYYDEEVKKRSMSYHLRKEGRS